MATTDPQWGMVKERLGDVPLQSLLARLRDLFEKSAPTTRYPSCLTMQN